MAQTETPKEAPWYDAYPAPESVAPSLPRHELLEWFQAGRKPGQDFVLVDVRRTDFEGGTIRGSINLPAHSLYPTLASVHALLASSGVHHVIWYCGSCGGRGPRAAAWFADYLRQVQDTSMTSMILEGGIKGWVAAGAKYTELMDGYDASFWVTK
ncbi:Rhodanese-like domain-containing protein [Penicillium macrosclerotiorum]|uniref:Rhodanese-like domain-containing protein n=1 Tax=Penicillium macrosclerotiorum TaxID=303699 RepID=UPI0025489528|nr:Rhodanese-like domain-containing protein [Penicillium macrosclerotiorum]KAJ5678671.1 Rhodanese-like domain-containing protein [Penicillium macrosclerotiorum]